MEPTVNIPLSDYEKLKNNVDKSHTVIVTMHVDRYMNYPEFISQHGHKFSRRYSQTFNVYSNEKELEDKLTIFLKSSHYENNMELTPYNEMKCKFTESYVDHLQTERTELAVELDRIPNWIKWIVKKLK